MDRAISLYRNVKMHSDKQHAMSSHELQIALMFTMEFKKKYEYIILGKLYQLCHLNNKYRYYKQYVIYLPYQQFWNCTVSELALSPKPFGIGHIYIYTLLRMTML
jgi:hypothetical protein